MNESKKSISNRNEAEVFNEAAKTITAFERAIQSVTALSVAVGAGVETAVESARCLAELTQAAAEAGARKALEEQKKSQIQARKEWHNKRLYNTKLLLKNYRMLNEHINSAIFEQEHIDEYTQESAQDILELMWQANDSDVIVESIKKSVARTKIIMAHVNTMLELYETFCEKSSKEEDWRRWRVTKSMYISPVIMSAEEIAQEEHIDKRTVYRDIDASVERISALIFGINGLKGK